VVVADGRFLRASATKSHDLFWALRGGSGNLGVVTSFEYQLHAVGPMIVRGGWCATPWARPRRCSAPPLSILRPAIHDMLGPLPYTAQQSLTDAALPAGSFYYTKGGFLSDLTDEAIEVFAEYAATKPPLCRRSSFKRCVAPPAESLLTRWPSPTAASRTRQ
jgi:hypothetical protein